jgi:hypothetical protein
MQKQIEIRKPPPAAAAVRAASAAAAEAKELTRKRESLLLSRSRVVNDLGSATSERYREVLKRGLEYLDDELGRVDKAIDAAERATVGGT